MNNNKIILVLNDGSEITVNKADFILLEGKNNTVKIKVESEEKFNCLKGLAIYVFGDNNSINLGNVIYPYNASIGLTGLTINIGNPPDDAFVIGMERPANNCKIEIGDDVVICGARLFLQDDNTSITIGNNCMISWGIDIWCTDVHTITDLDGNAQNYGKSIEIGNHVWIGKDVKIGKNTKVSDDSIIGWGSIVTRKFEETNVILAGNPAKIIKKDINWNFRDLQNYRIYKNSIEKADK